MFLQLLWMATSRPFYLKSTIPAGMHWKSSWPRSVSDKVTHKKRYTKLNASFHHFCNHEDKLFYFPNIVQDTDVGRTWWGFPCSLRNPQFSTHLRNPRWIRRSASFEYKSCGMCRMAKCGLVGQRARIHAHPHACLSVCQSVGRSVSRSVCARARLCAWPNMHGMPMSHTFSVTSIFKQLRKSACVRPWTRTYVRTVKRTCVRAWVYLGFCVRYLPLVALEYPPENARVFSAFHLALHIFLISDAHLRRRQSVKQ